MIEHRLFYGNTRVSGFAELLERLPNKEFSSVTRSTIPLLSLVRQGGASWDALLQRSGMALDADLHFEFRFSPESGRGGASATDLLCRSGDQTLAIEAKWTEGRYATVRQWLQGGANPENRNDVLSSWLQPLTKGSPPFDFTLFNDCIYQLIHRAASACDNGREAHFTLISFYLQDVRMPAPVRHAAADLAKLAKALGPLCPVRLSHCVISMVPTAACREIAKLPRRAPDLAQRLRKALLEDPLFSFAIPQDYTATQPE